MTTADIEKTAGGIVQNGVENSKAPCDAAGAVCAGVWVNWDRANKQVEPLQFGEVNASRACVSEHVRAACGCTPYPPLPGSRSWGLK